MTGRHWFPVGPGRYRDRPPPWQRRARDRQEGMAIRTFMVEGYWPGITEAQVREIVERPGLAGHPPGQREIHLLGSLLVPSDGMVIFLFEGASPSAIREAASLADVPFDRIVEVRHVLPPTASAAHVNPSEGAV